MTTTSKAEGPARPDGPRGSARRPEYRIYRGMLRRCYAPRCREYPLYGGRGIGVCPRWRGPGGFARFLRDPGPRPFPRASIHRLDNDGGYEPGNVAWADQRTQTRNKRNNHRLTHDGRTLALSAWAEQLGMRPGTLSRRLLKGWSVEDALTGPSSRASPRTSGSATPTPPSAAASPGRVRPLLRRRRRGWKPLPALGGHPKAGPERRPSTSS